jgi:hypothetical protein
LFPGYESASGCHALPSAVGFDPRIHKSFAVHKGLPFFGALHAKDSSDDRGIAVDLDGRLFRDSIG